LVLKIGIDWSIELDWTRMKCGVRIRVLGLVAICIAAVLICIVHGQPEGCISVEFGEQQILTSANSDLSVTANAPVVLCVQVADAQFFPMVLFSVESEDSSQSFSWSFYGIASGNTEELADGNGVADGSMIVPSAEYSCSSELNPEYELETVYLEINSNTNLAISSIRYVFYDATPSSVGTLIQAANQSYFSDSAGSLVGFFRLQYILGSTGDGTPNPTIETLNFTVEAVVETDSTEPYEYAIVSECGDFSRVNSSQMESFDAGWLMNVSGTIGIDEVYFILLFPPSTNSNSDLIVFDQLLVRTTTFAVIPPDEPCFPADALVQLENNQVRRMDQLEIGDKVRVSESEYSPIFMFGHNEAKRRSSFVRLEIEIHDEQSDTSNAKQQLELLMSERHYIYKCNEQNACRLLEAQRVQVGDFVTVFPSGSAISVRGTVVDTSRVERSGLYHPHTMHGDIIVNGVLVSCYAGLVRASLAHILMSPLRILYRVFDLSFPSSFLAHLLSIMRSSALSRALLNLLGE